MLLSEFLARVLQCTADEKKLLNIELQANNGDDGDVDANGDFIVNHLNAMRLSGDDEPNTLICLAADDKSSSEDEEDDAVVGLDMTSSKGYGHDLPFHLPSWLAMDVDIESDAGGGGDGWYYEDEEGDDADTLQAETDAEHLPSMLLDLYMDDNSKNTNANSAASVDISSNNNNNNSSGGGGSSLAPLLDGEWLLVQCQQQVILFSDDHGLTGEQLSQKILSILTSTSNDDGIQNLLVDLLGYENFDFLTTLITNRQHIISLIKEQQAMMEAPKKSISSNNLSSTPTTLSTTNSLTDLSKPPQPHHGPTHGTQITVMSEQDKLEMKQMRKEMKKRSKMTEEERNMETSASMLGLDGDYLRQAREEQLLYAASAPLVQSGKSGAKIVEEEQYPNVYRSGTASTKLPIFSSQFVLPVGTERFSNDSRYEEMVIPYPKPSLAADTQKLVSIASLDDFAKRAFKGYSNLNRVQSLVYPIAYGTNENMLVCAPTGAGKTDVAMLTVMRALSQFIVTGDDGKSRLAKDDFKIVYVAPMKALAAEVVQKFGSRLGGSFENGDGIGLSVRELTGDMQLTKTEISNTQMIVTTPEKWDVVTRKGVGDTELTQKVRLLIIDEVHLLNEDRGSVIESIIARTLRQVETTQSMIRIIGLSATLPNFVDVARFLGVNLYQGMFYFDSSFRPVPLKQHFIGVKGKSGSSTSQNYMNQVCYEKVVDLVAEGHQVMVFVHARKETVKTASYLRDEAGISNALGVFDCTSDPQYGLAVKEMTRSRNNELKSLFSNGFGIHHAGMLRSDRSMVERFFEKGLIRVLCCTATLAWGVNLPAFAVVIKGTQVYNAEKGAFVDLSILDVLQIFGRAGRPQYEDHGEGYIITSHDKLTHYISQITQQHPIESRFAENLADNLNAEIAIGTVTNIDEAVRWLSYTYMNVRMAKNPFHYGMDWKEIQEADGLVNRRRALITAAATTLAKAQMIIFDRHTNYLSPKDLGRIASNFYIKTLNIELFNGVMIPRMTEADVLSMMSKASEFENIKSRDEEVTELKKFSEDPNICPCQIKGGLETNHGKTNVLLQAFVSQASIEDFALVSDTAYVAKNAARILRALFEICLSRNWGPATTAVLGLCKSVDKRLWSFEHPLAQFDLPYNVITKLDNFSSNMTIEEMREMSSKEIGETLRFAKMGETVSRCLEQFPVLDLEVQVSPITKSVLRITLFVTPNFKWNDRVHGSSEPFYIFVEDPEHTEILHHEYFLLSKRQQNETQKLGFVIPIPKTSATSDELPPQIYVRSVSEKWIGAETIIPISFKHLILPELYKQPYTDLLDLQPLSITALRDPILEEICTKRFEYFNPVQTQFFHILYYTDYNSLVGAPTGSGKTLAAELSMWAAFRDRPKSKVVYIAPLKALVKERVADWNKRLTGLMSRSMVELTGDITPDISALQSSDIIITTPEKWDGISRNWQNRGYVKDVSLVIIDEIHLLGGDRGPILEVIVSRMNYISSQTDRKVRIVGLSTALANASDLADWLNIKPAALFNFRHSVRPVPLEIHISGYAGKHYCPRMMSMNKPCYSAILSHSPDKPVIVFVSSRRQTRLTANDLISLCALDDNPKRFLKMDERDSESIVERIKDQPLAHALSFGIGLHHAGLVESDRKVVEELFFNGKIQVLVATSTLAWGINMPAHLVVIKGTEFYDAKVKGYVDFPITDVLQMMGRAGRPQFDTSGVACVFVHDIKKNFYKKFLHEPFPVESSLHTCLHDHLNAEIVGGSIKSKQDAVDYLTWTYFYRRLQMNPTYYGVEDVSPEGISIFLSMLVEETLLDLSVAGCIELGDENGIESTILGGIASYYYLSYKTAGILRTRLKPDYRAVGDASIGERPDGDFISMIRILAEVTEYNELPVRHNEDIQNQGLEKLLSYPAVIPIINNSDVPRYYGGFPLYQTWDSPNLKAFLLIQSHIERNRRLPSTDYIPDTNSVLDQAIRVLQAMIDISADQGQLQATLGVITVMQCIKQAMWAADSELLILPNISTSNTEYFSSNGVNQLTDFKKMKSTYIKTLFQNTPGLSARQADDMFTTLSNLPDLKVKFEIVTAGSVASATAVSEILKASKTNEWRLKASQEYDLNLEIFRYGAARIVGNEIKASAPYFPKPQSESWIAVLGEESTDELYVVKRTSLIPSKSSSNVTASSRLSLRFMAPENPGKTRLSLQIMSDVYRGVDYVVEISVDVVECFL